MKYIKTLIRMYGIELASLFFVMVVLSFINLIFWITFLITN